MEYSVTLFVKAILALTLIASLVFSEEITAEDEECIDAASLTTTQAPQCPPSENVVNVAVGKASEQSTTYFDYGSWKAVDGDTTQSFHPTLTCSHTAEDANEGDTKPWLRVDLGSPHVVEYVKLYSRSDPCCGKRYHDLEVRVGNHKEKGRGNKFSLNPVCDSVQGGNYPVGKIFEFHCPKCMMGEHVSVQITKDFANGVEGNILSICELEIYGYPL